MTKKISTLLIAGLFSVFAISAQTGLPSKILGDVNVGENGYFLSNGAVEVGANATSNGRIVNNGTLILNDSITFVSDATSDGLLLNKNEIQLGASVTPNDIVVLKRLPETKWYQITFPFDVLISDIKKEDGTDVVLDTDFFLNEYDAKIRAIHGFRTDGSTPPESENPWQFIADETTVLKAGVGYMVYPGSAMNLIFPSNEAIPVERTYVPDSKTTTYTYRGGSELSYRDALDWGWVLMGAQQTSLYSLSKNSLSGLPAVYYYDGQNWTNQALPDGVIVEGNIFLSPYNPFFAQIPGAGDGAEYNVTVIPSAAAIEIVSGGMLLRSDEDGLSEFNGIALNISNTEESDILYLALGEIFSDDFVIGEDAIRMLNPVNTTPQIYTQAESLPILYNKIKFTEEEIPVGFVGKEGSYSFSLSKVVGLSGRDIFLIDKESNQEYNLRESDYSFDLAAAGAFEDRFAIRFTKDKTGSEIIDTQIKVYTEQTVVYVENIEVGDVVTIYSVSGQVLAKIEANSTVVSYNLPQTGVYIVTVNGETNHYSTKVISKY